MPPLFARGGDDDVELIPVGSGDEAFLFQVYAGTRREEVAAWGWDAAQQEAFLHMQFQVQQRAYQMQFPDAEHCLIVHDGCRVGRMILQRSKGALHLVDIALLPEYRGAGFGTAVLRALQEEAARAGKPLRLRVMKGNPARRLYARLGFAVTGESATHDAMEWSP